MREEKKAREIAAKISQLKTLAERREELQKVPHSLRHQVEFWLAIYFEVRRKDKRGTL